MKRLRIVRHIMRTLADKRGFSFIELMIAITIMSILSIVAFQSYRGVTQRARVARTQQTLSSLATVLERYNLDNGTYPTTEQGLEALLKEPPTPPIPSNYNPGGYIRGNTIPKDGWGNDFYYASPGSDDNEYDLKSYGADGQEGGEEYNAEISVWDL